MDFKQQFLSTTTLLGQQMDYSRPWTFAPENLEEIRKMTKRARTARMSDPGQGWDIYSVNRGIDSYGRISKENPVFALRGLAVDYDAVQSLDSVHEQISRIKIQDNKPQFIEVTLSKRIRLVWIFEKEVMVPNNRYAEAVMREFFRKLKIETLLPGYDPASAKVTQVWTNGGEWHCVKETPMPWNTIFGILSSVVQKEVDGHSELPLTLIADEVGKRFPNKWDGKFELNSYGPRFWDPTADNPRGCMVKADGMLCFTGRTPFVTWAQIFGYEWTEQQRVLNLGAAASNTFFDGKRYWTPRASTWKFSSREDTLLQLKASGISGRAPRGESLSDADRVLHHIQNANRIDGAAPLINFPTGVVHLENQQILNTANLKMVKPSSLTRPVPEKDFPLIDKMTRIVDHQDLGAYDALQAWAQRFLRALMDNRQSMGQAIFLCGPKNNGKTLLCMRILKPLFGNVIANPYDYFTGKTTFNDELFRAPLLAINDEEGVDQVSTLRKFESRIKAFTVNPTHTYHPKFCDRLSVAWTGRIFVTLNDDPASIGILPEVNGNTADKLMFFASKNWEHGPWPDNHVVEGQIAGELPHYVKWLLDVYEPPKDIVIGGRMGIKSFFDPRILGLSKQQAFSHNLLELLKLWVNSADVFEKTHVWTGTPSDLFSQVDGIGHLQNMMREWNVSKLAKNLTALARVDGTGVTLMPGYDERVFLFDKNKISQPKENNTNGAHSNNGNGKPGVVAAARAD